MRNSIIRESFQHTRVRARTRSQVPKCMVAGAIDGAIRALVV